MEPFSLNESCPWVLWVLQASDQPEGPPPVPFTPFTKVDATPAATDTRYPVSVYPPSGLDSIRSNIHAGGVRID